MNVSKNQFNLVYNFEFEYLLSPKRHKLHHNPYSIIPNSKVLVYKYYLFDILYGKTCNVSRTNNDYACTQVYLLNNLLITVRRFSVVAEINEPFNKPLFTIANIVRRSGLFISTTDFIEFISRIFNLRK